MQGRNSCDQYFGVGSVEHLLRGLDDCAFLVDSLTLLNASSTSLNCRRTCVGAGLTTALATGDGVATAKAVATRLGIANVYGEFKPQDKPALVQRMQRESRVVAMAGGGINDAPALAKADVGIAMGTSTDVALNSAHVTLVRGNLRAIARSRALSLETVRNMRRDLGFAFVYNALGIALVAGMLYPFTGQLLSPMIAALAMSLSSVSVIGNALRLRGTRVAIQVTHFRCLR